jgi:hypothetical protein
MKPADALLLSAFAVAAVVVTARWLDARVWRRSLMDYRLRLPADLTMEHVTNWLSSLSAVTHAPRGALLPQPPIVMEVVADAAGVRHGLLVPRQLSGAVLASLRAALPGVRLEEVPGLTTHGPVTGYSFAAELHLFGRRRQLAVERGEAASRALLAGLQPLRLGEVVCWQWIATGAGTPPPVRTATSGDNQAVTLPWWLESEAPSDADELRAARLKQRQPLLNATGRLTVIAADRRRALTLFGQAWGNVRLLNVPGARLVRSWWPSRVVLRRASNYWLPLLGWPLHLNAAELAGLLALPVGEAPLPGVPAAVARQVPPPVEMANEGTVLADSTYPGMSRPLFISPRDRLLHVALLGPTGTGKSTLMISMAVQDAANGDGLAVLDPKADMAADVLSHLPASRRDDVIVVNPADTDRPVGFNVLASDGTETGRELAVDHVLHVFHEHWKEFWGPRTDAVLRAGLLVLTSAKASDGTAFTVCELPALLTDTGFRRWVTNQASVPSAVHDFMAWFESLSSAERTQVVGPVLNKLTALTQRTPIRLMLGQSSGLDLATVLNDGKILVMPLSRGLVGSETAALLSSLMMASLWQAALGRVRLPAAKRKPFWLFVDEASEVVRLPLDLADVMAEARGLGVGLVLAAQHAAQLPPPVRHALLATVRSQVVFQLEPADARLLARSFEPTLTEADLRALGTYEVAMRLAINGQTSRPMTGTTRPLPPATTDATALRQRSRERYGTPRAAVERALRERLGYAAASNQYLGRRPRRAGGQP